MKQYPRVYTTLLPFRRNSTDVWGGRSRGTVPRVDSKKSKKGGTNILIRCQFRLFTLRCLTLVRRLTRINPKYDPISECLFVTSFNTYKILDPYSDFLILSLKVFFLFYFTLHDTVTWVEGSIIDNPSLIIVDGGNVFCTR